MSRVRRGRHPPNNGPHAAADGQVIVGSIGRRRGDRAGDGAGGTGIPPLFGPAKPAAVAASVLLVATLLVFGDVLFGAGGDVLSAEGGDLSQTFVGWRQFTAAELAAGHLPLWNPHLFGGTPCLGGFQAALLYPPNWLQLLLPLVPAINAGIALHVFLAGFFTYLWAVRRGARPAAAALAGATFMFGGAYFLHIGAGHLPNLCAMVWPPLMFLAIDDLARVRSLRGAWLLAGAAAMQILAGHPQYVYYTALVSVPYAVAAFWGARGAEKAGAEPAGAEPAGSDLGRSAARRRVLLGLGLAGAGAAALSAAQLFTGLQAAGESLRSGLTIEVARTFPFPPENLVTLVLPDLFGKPFATGPAIDEPAGADSGDADYWGRWYLWEDSLFIGGAALALAAYGAVRGGKDVRRGALAMAALCLVLALGRYTPLHALLYRALPGFGSFRGASKFGFLGMLFVALLVAAGFDQLLRVRPVPRGPAALLAAAALLLAAAGVAVRASGAAGKAGAWGAWFGPAGWSDEGYRYGPLARAAGAAVSEPFMARAARTSGSDLLTASAGCAAAAGFWVVARRRHGFTYGVAAVAAAQLLGFAAGNRPTFPIEPVLRREEVVRGLVTLAGPDYRIMAGLPAEVLGVGGDDAWGNDPMVLRRYAEFMAYDQGLSASDLVRAPYPFFREPSPMWALVRLKTVLAPSGGSMARVPLPAPPLGRAQLVERVAVVRDHGPLLAALADPGFNPRATVLLEEAPPLVAPLVTPLPRPASEAPGPASRGTTLPSAVPGTSPSVSRAGTVAVTDRSTDELEVTADVWRPCVLLLTDNYSAGWGAEPLEAAPSGQQDGYRVLPADYTLRGVPLAPGHHHFLVAYRPIAFRIGKWVSLASAVAYVLIGLWLFRRRAGPAVQGPPGPTERPGPARRSAGHFPDDSPGMKSKGMKSKGGRTQRR